MKNSARFWLMIIVAVVCAGRMAAQTKPPASNPRGQTPASTDARPVEAQKAIASKDFGRAVTLLSEYLTEHPADAEMHFQLGYAYSSLKRNNEAVGEYQRAAELKPAFAIAHLNLGLTLLEMNEPARATKSFERAAELMPDQARPRFLYGVALEESGNLAGAIAQYQLASTLDARDYDAFFRWGIALLRSGKPTEAEPHLRQAIALLPDQRPAHLALANVLIEEKKNEAAVEELTGYVKNHPNDVDELTELGVALNELGRYDEAIAALDRADAIAPISVIRAKLRASILISQQKWDAAAKVLTEAVQTSPLDAALHWELGRILLERRYFPDAERELRRALDLDGTQTGVLRDLASTVYLAGNYAGALGLYDRLAQREPPTAYIFFLRATCYDKLDRKPEAIAAYQKFLEQDQGKSDKEEFQARERVKVLERELSKKK